MRKRIGDRYELVEEIGSGGMGSVWRGYDSVLDREIAVKMIRLTHLPFDADLAELAERFRREARITAHIRHHGVPQVHDAVLDAELDNVYLVMELVEGSTTLGQFITPDLALPIDWAASIAAQIATALSYAHALPVVHRDLKPDNILVTPDGTVKIIDFGIAALLRPDTPKLTMTGAAVGTAAYMSPEQILGGKVTPRTDLYALGCILHEMLCGQVVFGGSMPMVMQHHAFTAPVPPRELRDDVPLELDSLVLDLLAKTPEQRPADAAEVYERLLPLLPVAGMQQPPVGGYLSGFPDPTRIFRHPNAPLRQERVAPTMRFPGALPATTPVSDEALDKLIAASEDEYYDLLDAHRYAQAADVLGAVVTTAGQAYGLDSRRVLDIRVNVAAAYFLGGDYRKARSEFDSLAEAFARIGGFSEPMSLECRGRAVDCRIELGEVTVALSGLESVLSDVRSVQGDGSELAVELRFNLGLLLAMTGELAKARTTLEALYEDLHMLRGPDDDLTHRVGAAIERLDGTPGS
ncbi:protein kinase domain-containing protein [Nocardia sp. NPDC055002]